MHSENLALRSSQLLMMPCLERTASPPLPKGQNGTRPSPRLPPCLNTIKRVTLTSSSHFSGQTFLLQGPSCQVYERRQGKNPIQPETASQHQQLCAVQSTTQPQWQPYISHIRKPRTLFHESKLPAWKAQKHTKVTIDLLQSLP